jgi:hypothetical protein
MMMLVHFLDGCHLVADITMPCLPANGMMITLKGYYWEVVEIIIHGEAFLPNEPFATIELKRQSAVTGSSA